MATADELRNSLAAAHTVLGAAITAAADKWETPQGTDADGSPGWSPRQVAEHVIAVEMPFAEAVCGACGREAPANPLADGAAFSTADEALVALAAVSTATNASLQLLQDSELGNTHSEGPLAGMPVADIIMLDVWHLVGHASQTFGPMGG